MSKLTSNKKGDIKEPCNSKPACHHGGDISYHSQRLGIAKEHWIDLSTGINPNWYPAQDIKADSCTEMPYADPAFLNAAENYYGNNTGLPLLGSQQFISLLPFVMKGGTALIPRIGYKEYAHQWLAGGNSVVLYDTTSTPSLVSLAKKHNATFVTIINPNNPSGEIIDYRELLVLSEDLLRHNIFVIVDEAYMDLTPENSLLNTTLPNNLIVLKSFGKFFGLPGLRLGWIYCNNTIRQQLNSLLGPWNINSAAQQIAVQAYEDVQWQEEARNIINRESSGWFKQVEAHLSQYQIKGCYPSGLFCSFLFSLETADEIFEALAQQGILVRLWKIDDCLAYIRIGFLSTRQKEKQLSVLEALAAAKG